jgi:hypothetical protein
MKQESLVMVFFINRCLSLSSTKGTACFIIPGDFFSYGDVASVCSLLTTIRENLCECDVCFLLIEIRYEARKPSYALFYTSLPFSFLHVKDCLLYYSRGHFFIWRCGFCLFFISHIPRNITTGTHIPTPRTILVSGRKIQYFFYVGGGA